MFKFLLRFARVELLGPNFGVTRFCVLGPFLLVFWNLVFVLLLRPAWVILLVLPCSLRLGFNSGVGLNFPCLDGRWGLVQGKFVVIVSFLCTFVNTGTCSRGGSIDLALQDVR